MCSPRNVSNVSPKPHFLSQNHYGFTRRVLHAIQTRDALIDFFVARQKVSRATLLV